MLITYEVCTEEEYKKQAFSMCGMMTVVLSLLCLATHPLLVVLVVVAFTALVFCVVFTHTQK